MEVKPSKEAMLVRAASSSTLVSIPLKTSGTQNYTGFTTICDANVNDIRSKRLPSPSVVITRRPSIGACFSSFLIPAHTSYS
jgi:hypothetical protein